MVNRIQNDAESRIPSRRENRILTIRVNNRSLDFGSQHHKPEELEHGYPKPVQENPGLQEKRVLKDRFTRI